MGSLWELRSTACLFRGKLWFRPLNETPGDGTLPLNVPLFPHVLCASPLEAAPTEPPRLPAASGPLPTLANPVPVEESLGRFTVSFPKHSVLG